MTAIPRRGTSPWPEPSIFSAHFALLFGKTLSDVTGNSAFTSEANFAAKTPLVAHKDSLRIFLFAFVAQVAHDVHFNFADAFK